MPQKRKKHPDAPKGAMGAYMFFCKEQREVVKEEHPGIGVKMILSELGKRWGNLAPEDKKPYEEMAGKDKIRFDKEKVIFLQTHESLFNDIEKKKKRKRKKDPNAPKKNRSSYILFVNHHRQQAIDELPDEAKQTEIMSKVAQMWREASDTVRAQYTEMAEREKEVYTQRLREYQATLE